MNAQPAQALPDAAAPGSACGTGHGVAALYVSPDGTYEVRYGPPYGRYKPPAGHHREGERAVTLSADAAEARLLAPTWQETAKAIRPALPGLPPPALEAYARALLAEVMRRAWDSKLKCPAPFLYREDHARALVTSAREALSHGDRAAAVRQGPSGTWEVSVTGMITTIPAVLPCRQLRQARSGATPCP